MSQHWLTEFSHAHRRYRRLRGATRHLYTALAWLMVIAGCVLCVAGMYATRRAFGLPLEAGSLEGIRLQFLGWVVITVLSVPPLFYVGMMLVGGLFALVMLLAGRFTGAQAWAFTRFAQPPDHWLPDTRPD